MSDSNQDSLEVSESSAGAVRCLGMSFESETARREHFTEILRQKLGDSSFRQTSGFPVGSDEAILAMSDPPYYTACPNPWLENFVRTAEEVDGSNGARTREPWAVDTSVGKSDLLYQIHPYHTKVPHLAIVPLILHYTKPGDVVLDAFCGSGMTGVAAQYCDVGPASWKRELEEEWRRDGMSPPIWGARRTVLGDLSPAATFISSHVVTSIDVEAFEQACRSILSRLDEQLGWMYQTMHSDGRVGRIEYTLWSEVFACPECAAEIDFYEVVVDASTKKVMKEFSCPNCRAVLTRKKIERVYQTRIDPASGSTHQAPKRVPSLISYRVGGGVFEKRPDDTDLRTLAQIRELDLPERVPTSELPYMHMTHERARMDQAGVTHFHHFFLPRVQQFLGELWSAVADIDDSSVRRTVKFWAEQAIWTSSLMNRYQAGGFKQINKYLPGVYYIAAQHTEPSPWYALEGRLKRMVSALGSYRPRNGSVFVTTSDSARLGLDDASVDYIFTDPPFGENIYYADLNYLIESWHGVLTDSETEAIIDRAKKKALADYRELMRACFNEYFRVLKPGSWMTLVFSNSANAVWHAIQEGLSSSGFVVADVRTLDKQLGSYRQVTSTAVKQDLVISAYKPSLAAEHALESSGHSDRAAWDFVHDHLLRVPTFSESGGVVEVVKERTTQVLYDRMVAAYVQRGRAVPLSIGQFRVGLDERFSHREGMYFLAEQVADYDRRRMKASELRQLSLFVSDESSAIQWVRQQLQDKPQSFQQLQPRFMQQLQQWSKHEEQVELRDLLEQNFLRYDGTGPVPSQIHSYLSTNFASMRNRDNTDLELRTKGENRWYVPDPAKEDDLQKLRNRTLLKLFEEYRASSSKRLREFRTEAVRVGFKDAYDRGDYSSIVAVAEKLPDSALQEDEKLLMYYDVAQMRIDG